MWRPDNWDTYDEWYKRGCNSADKTLAEIFEAGADAMIGALRRERGIPITKQTLMCTSPVFLKDCDSGYLVFIPDEEPK